MWQLQQEKYKFKYQFTLEEIKHFLMPRENVVWTYVIEDKIDGKAVVTDFFSMTRLTQKCLAEGVKYDKMQVGTLYYYGLTVNDYY